MAKKPKKADAKPAVLTTKDKKTLSALRELSGAGLPYKSRLKGWR